MAFLAVAIPLAVSTPSARSGSLTLAALLMAAYALASLVEFEVGPGAAVPTQLVLVPMLFVLPTGWVPLTAAAGFALGGVVCSALRLGSCGSPIVLIGSSWYAVGPAIVLLAAGESAPAWSHWPIYIAAFGAQFAFDLASTVVAGLLAGGTRATFTIRVMASVYLIDVLLAPVGFAFAALATGSPYVVVGVLPLLVLMGLFARDRHARIESLRELGETYRGTAVVLGDVIEADDAYTGDHSHSVQELCLAVADALGLDPAARREVEFTALLHDVGKLRIPKEIINKPGALSVEERAVIETHTIEGERLLAQAGGFLSEIGGIVRSCHEHHDGAGYPDGLAGDEIPLAARIVACCDAYDAMTTDRPYRRAMPAEVALQEIRASAGAQFCPEVVDALVIVLAGAVVNLTRERVAEARPAVAADPTGKGYDAAIEAAAGPQLGATIRERRRIAKLRSRTNIAPAVSAYLPGGVFLSIAIALPCIVQPTLTARTGVLLLALVAAYAIAYGIQFEVGPGSAVPTQLVVVPMLVLLPVSLVPILVGLAILLRAGWDPDACNCTSRQRPFVLLAGGWYTLGPVTILLVSGETLAGPLLAAAVLSQIALDAIVTVLRVSVALGFSVRALARNLVWTYAADIALTPAALAIAAPSQVNAAMAAAAAVGLLGFLATVASDRQRHLRQVTGLADAYREAAERARRDALTGLANRLGWDEAIAGIRDDQAAALILLDVNGLKAANDTRGHLFGDQVLSEVAATIARALPHADLVARLSGDEFAVLLLDDNAATVDYSAHRLRSLFAAHPGIDGHPVAAAVGHAAVPPGADPRTALEAADKAVYAEKAAANLRDVGGTGRRISQARHDIAGAYAGTTSGRLVRLPPIVNGGQSAADDVASSRLRTSTEATQSEREKHWQSGSRSAGSPPGTAPRVPRNAPRAP